MYEAFYRLRAKPFQLSPDPRFFYKSQTHKRALAYLRYGVQQGEGFIVITGDVGTGKSMLVETLLKYLENENIIAAQLVTTQLQATDLLRMAARAFGVAYTNPSKAVLLAELESFLGATIEEGKRALLVVDEAQGLPRESIEELRMLSNFQRDGQVLLQTFLLGQEEFRNVLRSEGFEQLRQRVIASYHLTPLAPEETQKYIEHRLFEAGWSRDPNFTEDAYREIFEFSGGVPRRINSLCDRLLLYGSIEGLHTLDRAAFRAVAEELMEEQGGASDREAPVRDFSAGEGKPESKRSGNPSQLNKRWPRD